MINSSRQVFAMLLLGSYLFVSDMVQAQPQEAVTVNTDLVTTWVQATNRTDGLPVKRLTKADFQLREDGKPEAISVVKEEEPLAVMILINGLGGWLRYPAWYQRMPDILRELGEDVEIAVMLYDSTTVLAQPLTKDVNVVAEKFKDKEALFNLLGRHLPERIAEAPPGEIVLPRVGDAAYKAALYLEKAASPTRRKIIIFITQRSFWMDETTMHTGAEVEALLEQTGTTVYSLLHDKRFKVNGSNTRVHGNDPLYYLVYRQRVKNRLRGGTIEGFVKATGGTSVRGHWEDCDDMFVKLAQQIRSTYMIGYYPKNTNFDGRFRRIKVELSKSGKAKAGNVRIVAREGYHAVRRSFQRATETPSKQ